MVLMMLCLLFTLRLNRTRYKCAREKGDSFEFTKKPFIRNVTNLYKAVIFCGIKFCIKFIYFKYTDFQKVDTLTQNLTGSI